MNYVLSEAHGLKLFDSGSELGLIGISLVQFPVHAVSILFVSIFGHEIGVLKSPALF